ncbi:PREDICTED: uncharacterized protein LOC105559403 [Vollenhovia emeryi]|uniref:uncharacterized protein LOC105559403 n=1 Tax=Vollenhovia emeryi TaxID=411798 RepID=UPI0005F45BBF|nr:PREDICTED: uncharacterized protein LOC105559403 [Vollenhovia emeryi]
MRFPENNRDVSKVHLTRCCSSTKDAYCFRNDRMHRVQQRDTKYLPMAVRPEARECRRAVHTGQATRNGRTGSGATSGRAYIWPPTKRILHVSSLRGHVRDTEECIIFRP